MEQAEKEQIRQAKLEREQMEKREKKNVSRRNVQRLIQDTEVKMPSLQTSICSMKRERVKNIQNR